MEALAFLAKPPAKIGPLYVLHGDEAFLKRQVIQTIRQRALGDSADEGGVSTYPGDKAQFAEVIDELETAPFFAPRRVVLVESADPFVTRFRGLLEKKVDQLMGSGVLLLEVKTWASNTRLAKMVPASAAIVCKAPASYKIASWCSEWSAAHHGKQLPATAAQLLVDLVGGEMGQLDQELEKLSIYVGQRQRIEPADVDKLVGQSRAENIWKILDAVAEHRPAQALQMLGRLFEQGEEPMRVLGALGILGMQLRRLAQAGRLTVQGSALAAALSAAGVPPFAVDAAERQLRHLGRARAAQLYDWLLELNWGLRGGSPLPERTQFERLLVRMARPHLAERR
jgi:DNA polymerase-3 subunit delta